jgi:hypothetical protein
LTWCAVGATALAVLFLLHQRQRSHLARMPLIDPVRLRRVPYLLGCAVAATQFGAQMSALPALTMFLQDGLGLSASASAAVILPMASAMAVTSGLAGRAAGRLGHHVITMGIVVSACFLVGAGSAAQLASPGVLPPTPRRGPSGARRRRRRDGVHRPGNAAPAVGIRQFRHALHARARIVALWRRLASGGRWNWVRLVVGFEPAVTTSGQIAGRAIPGCVGRSQAMATKIKSGIALLARLLT